MTLDVYLDTHLIALCMQSGKAEYKSVTVSLDATAEEFTDFYLDDDIRPTWVSCSGFFVARCLVVSRRLLRLCCWLLQL